MKNLILALALVATTGLPSLSQNQSFTSNPGLSFEKFISGVKYAEIGLNPVVQAQVDKGEGIAAFYLVAQQYLKKLGFEYIALTSEEKIDMEALVGSYCEFTTVMFGGDIDKKSITNSTISFISCMGDIFGFQSDKKFTYGKFADVEKRLITDWKSIVSSKGKYDPKNQLVLPSNITNWNTQLIKDYLNSAGAKLKPIEGIYERVRMSFEDIRSDKYTLGIVKNPNADEYLVIYLSGAKNNTDWRAGEIKGRLFKTSTPGFYTVAWITRDKSLYEDVYCSLDETGVRFYSSGVMPISYRFIKNFPNQD